MNAYITVDEMKRRGVMDIKRSDSDLDMLRRIVAQSRRADGICQRFFFMNEQTKKFTADGSHLLELPDLISIDASGLTTDDDRDRVFETTWATTDYLLFPDNADPDTRLNPQSHPYDQIQADISAGTKSAFPAGVQTIQIAGEWGYWKHTRTATEVVSGAHTSSVTVLTVDARVDIEQGATILVGSEQMYVMSYSDAALNVTRGVNGSTAASLSGSEVISIFEYPPEVVDAVQIMVRRDHANAGANYANVSGLADGQIQTFGGLSRDARDLLQPFKRYVV
jgi:hypothetical protein